MKPIKMTIQAFGSYGKKTVIDFSKPNQNLFLITGDTGAGKTTIFDAMVFALYGEASSISNKKSGEELQSQFVSLDVEPYVELIFTEQSGTEVEEYTVVRKPRHLRPAKRKGAADQSVNEIVELTMPDGSMYPSKETDGKLEEIVGLSKDQFMQVAMIAQGEFMELLRAKSDDKKKIFQKLFRTEQFQRIINELDSRCKEKKKEIATIRTECKQEVSHIVIPEGYENSEELALHKRSIANADRLSIADMEILLEQLRALNDVMDAQLASQDETNKQLTKVRDEKRDEWQNAKTLLASYNELDAAITILAACEGQAPAIKDKEELTKRINDAYDIYAVYNLYAKAYECYSTIKTDLEKQQANLPALTADYTEKENVRAAEEKELEKIREALTVIRTRVDKTLRAFAQIDEKKRTIVSLKDEQAKATRSFEQATKAAADFETNVIEWNKQADQLKDTPAARIKWETNKDEANGIYVDIRNLKQLNQTLTDTLAGVQTKGEAYEAARQKHLAKKQEYDAKYELFIDAQAGFLAKKLQPGTPCPVCGSIEHPNPCLIADEHEELTKDAIDALAKEESELLELRNKAAMEASNETTRYNGLKEQFDAAMVSLRERITKSIGAVEEQLTLERASEVLNGFIMVLKNQDADLKRAEETLNKVTAELKNTDATRASLSDAKENANKVLSDVNLALNKAETEIGELGKQLEYASAEEARAASAEAEAKAKTAYDRYEVLKKTAGDAKTAKENAETLIADYSAKLPGLKDEFDHQKEAYEKIIQTKGISENDWKQIVTAHKKEEILILQQEIADFKGRKMKAEGAKAAAEKAIAGKEKPDVDQLEEIFNQAQKALDAYTKTYNDQKIIAHTNNQVYKALAPKMEDRAKLVAEYSRMESMYNRLAGKVTGGRMDIETYVQRYYLERILHAANTRFLDMSAGQFELRMMGVEEAAEGKNRGLDLMVYSNITGKERKINTLSGGESFMAALALALGMADQIQASSAAINLDVMFIDEGFGSLDDHSREQAIKVLQNMAGGSRMIGIISHVSELKQEIEDQLIVRKNDEGSYVEWQIS